MTGKEIFKNHVYTEVMRKLLLEPKRWLITGVAGFIGSNLLEHLLKLDQVVIGLDNFSTGKEKNLAEVKSLVTDQQWSKFTFLKGDIRDLAVCQQACSGIDYLLHEAALGSVPRSLEDPINTNENNISGTLNIFVSARKKQPCTTNGLRSEQFHLRRPSWAPEG